MIIIQASLLCLWFFVDQPHYEAEEVFFPPTKLTGHQYTCRYANNIGTIIGIVVNTILILFLVGTAVASRNIPTRFNEGKLIAVISIQLDHSVHMVSDFSGSSSICQIFAKFVF
jgi:hypothetical protein